jgi:hypothetical protein
VVFVRGLPRKEAAENGGAGAISPRSCDATRRAGIGLRGGGSMLIRHVLAACAVAGACTLVFLPARGGDPVPARNPVPSSQCEKACDDAQEKAGEKCSEIKDEADREKCQNGSYEESKRCKAACKNDPVEKCKDKCDEKADKDHAKCEAMKDGPEKAKCRQAAEEQRSSCYRDCDDLKK